MSFAGQKRPTPFFFFEDELFRLVVGKGGLVEVINKKLWREVTKGLNLPSSITSAAFTLRTQYVYLSLSIYLVNIRNQFASPSAAAALSFILNFAYRRREMRISREIHLLFSFFLLY